LLLVEMHDAFFRFGAGPLLGLGKISRRRDEDLAAAGMAGLLPGVVIRLDLLGEVRPGGMAHRGEDRRPAPADRREGVGGAGGNADRRRRLLVWLRHHCDVFETMVLAFV